MLRTLSVLSRQYPLIQCHARVDDSEMSEVFDMGIGFCYVVDSPTRSARFQSSKPTAARRR
jgi:phosphoribosylaminoimidazole (AIR) synthetase